MLSINLHSRGAVVAQSFKGPSLVQLYVTWVRFPAPWHKVVRKYVADIRALLGSNKKVVKIYMALMYFFLLWKPIMGKESG